MIVTTENQHASDSPMAYTRGWEGAAVNGRGGLLSTAAWELFCTAVGGGRFPQRSGGLFLRAVGEEAGSPQQSGALLATACKKLLSRIAGKATAVKSRQEHFAVKDTGGNQGLSRAVRCRQQPTCKTTSSSMTELEDRQATSGTAEGVRLSIAGGTPPQEGRGTDAIDAQAGMAGASAMPMSPQLASAQ